MFLLTHDCSVYIMLSSPLLNGTGTISSDLHYVNLNLLSTLALVFQTCRIPGAGELAHDAHLQLDPIDY